MDTNTISIVKVVQQHAHYYELHLSNGEEVVVHEDLLVRYRLLAGKEIEPQFLQQLSYEGEIQRGMSMAIHYISYRPRATLEVKNYLLRKQVDSIYIEDILSRLQEKGYLNDHAFAEKWVANRQLLKPKGKFALRAELQEKGIASHIIQSVLSTIDADTEREQALQTGIKKLRQWRGKDWRDVRPKLIRFLTGKGYEIDVIMSILSKLEVQFRDLA